MKLSHRDFRPQRRSKYVSQPPTRRPTLRILLLAAFGAVVYLKFDSFVSSRIFQVIRNPQLLRQTLARPGRLPEPLPATPAASAASLKWSADSSLVDLDCPSSRIESCIASVQALGSEAAGQLRALINKGAIRWELVPTKGLSARFRKTEATREDSLGWRVQSVGLSSDKGTVTITAMEPDGIIRYCNSGHCLDESTPAPPFAKYQRLDRPLDRPPQWFIRPIGGPFFHSILPGRIVEIFSPTKSVKIYHGRNIFSIYAGFSELRPNLRPGTMVDMNDTLGSVGRDGDSLGSLGLRIEKDGLFVDPIAFLGNMADTGAVTHGR